MVKELPSTFYKQLETELDAITNYWKTYSPDIENGGFLGARDHYNTLIANANKGIILNARILWSFSTIARRKEDQELEALVERSFNYLNDYFRDRKFGGVFWELDAAGKPINKRKQIYAQAFAIYALSEYYLLTQNEVAKDWALELFKFIELHAFDVEKNGYIEAFQEDWSTISDMRLSDKDQNAAKTMNTHLHVLEAYTTLYEISGKAEVGEALENLVQLFLEKFLNKDYNFELFFDEEWNLTSDVVSFGHDIESLWLIIEGARAVGNEDLIKKTEEVAKPIADQFLKKGYIKGKGVLNEQSRTTGHIDTDRHWWPQAEALVGLFYANELSPSQDYEDAILDIWKFTKEHIIDAENGEWFFRINEKFEPYKEEEKLGMWKCPYHNSRACVVLLNKK